jgi:hypothetical protein
LAQLSNFPRLRCAFVTWFYGAEAVKFREKWTGNSDTIASRAQVYLEIRRQFVIYF